jgi:hypothetical protein
MGTFAETTIVDYHLSFDDQGNKPPSSVSVCNKQTEVFCLQQTKGSFPFQFSACRKQMEVFFSVFRLQKTIRSQQTKFSNSTVFRLRNSGNMEIETWKNVDIDMDTWNLKGQGHEIIIG